MTVSCKRLWVFAVLVCRPRIEPIALESLRFCVNSFDAFGHLVHVNEKSLAGDSAPKLGSSVTPPAIVDLEDAEVYALVLVWLTDSRCIVSERVKKYKKMSWIRNGHSGGFIVHILGDSHCSAAKLSLQKTANWNAASNHGHARLLCGRGRGTTKDKRTVHGALKQWVVQEHAMGVFIV